MSLGYRDFPTSVTSVICLRRIMFQHQRYKYAFLFQSISACRSKWHVVMLILCLDANALSWGFSFAVFSVLFWVIWFCSVERFLLNQFIHSGVPLIMWPTKTNINQFWAWKIFGAILRWKYPEQIRTPWTWTLELTPLILWMREKWIYRNWIDSRTQEAWIRFGTHIIAKYDSQVLKNRQIKMWCNPISNCKKKAHPSNWMK